MLIREYCRNCDETQQCKLMRGLGMTQTVCEVCGDVLYTDLDDDDDGTENSAWQDARIGEDDEDE